jgi:hypothetical protein
MGSSGAGYRECPHDPPSPIFAWIHTGKWAIGASQKRPGPGRTSAGGTDPAPVDPGPTVMGSLDSIQGPRIKGALAPIANITNFPDRGGTMIQDHRITAQAKNRGPPTNDREARMDTCLGWGLPPPLLIPSSFIYHYCAPTLTVFQRLQGSVLHRLRRWYAERDPLAFAKVKALRRRGADSV